jgi:hypothetical protein
MLLPSFLKQEVIQEQGKTFHSPPILCVKLFHRSMFLAQFKYMNFLLPKNLFLLANDMLVLVEVFDY